MTTDAMQDDITWIVLINEHGDHSLWPASRPIPDGWREIGPEGDADTCAAWVDAHWTALKPASRTP